MAYGKAATHPKLVTRLCDRAGDGEILIDKRASVEIEDKVRIEAIGSLDLKGVGKPVETYKVIGLEVTDQR